jgi:hypothetical protein
MDILSAALLRIRHYLDSVVMSNFLRFAFAASYVLVVERPRGLSTKRSVCCSSFISSSTAQEECALEPFWGINRGHLQDELGYYLLLEQWIVLLALSFRGESASGYECDGEGKSGDVAMVRIDGRRIRLCCLE